MWPVRGLSLFCGKLLPYFFSVLSIDCELVNKLQFNANGERSCRCVLSKFLRANENMLSVPVVGEQKLPKRGDLVLIMALIFTFFTITL